MKISNFFKTHFFSIVLTFVDDFTLNSDNNKEIWSFGLCWPLLAFIGLFGLCGLGWFFKAKTGLCWWKLSTIDLFPTIRCQNQSPNEMGHFESVWPVVMNHNIWKNCMLWFITTGTFLWRWKCSTIQSCIFPKGLLSKSIL